MPWRDIIEGAPALPMLLGADLEPYPYISGYGLLRRMTQLGRLMGVELTALGFRNRLSSDALISTQRSGAPKTKLLAALGLISTRVGEYWSPEVWSPLRTGRLLQCQNLPIRDCPLCSAHGYHCALFQLPGVDQCPWHGAKLCNVCPQCGQVCQARFSSDLRLGRCECGYDAFDARTASVGMWEFPADDVDSWASPYLEWASEERRSRIFSVPDARSNWMGGYAALAAKTFELGGAVAAAQPISQVVEFSEFGDDPPAGEFWGWSFLASDRPLTFLPLPLTMHSKLTEATRAAVAMFPADTPIPIELATLNGLDEGKTLGQNLANRPDCFIAPHGLTADQGTWLNLTAVDPTAACFCGGLLNEVISALEVRSDCYNLSPHTALSHALDGIAGRRHLARALEEILSRAYSQGLEKFLRSLMVAQPSSAQQRWSLPTAEIVLGDASIRAVRVAWTQGQLAGRSRLVETTKLPPSAPSRRSSRNGPLRAVWLGKPH